MSNVFLNIPKVIYYSSCFLLLGETLIVSLLHYMHCRRLYSQYVQQKIAPCVVAIIEGQCAVGQTHESFMTMCVKNLKRRLIEQRA